MRQPDTSRLSTVPRPRARTPYHDRARVLLLLWILVVGAALCLAQTPSSAHDLAEFTGTWKASFQGRTWLVLTLSRSGKTLKGSLSHSLLVAADDEGEISAVGPDMAESQIVDADLENGVLTLRAQDSEGLADTYEMTLTGSDSAALRSAAQDETEPGSAPSRKPVKLTRTQDSTQ